MSKERFFYPESLGKLIGKTLKSVEMDKEKDHITLHFTDGDKSYSTEGDCCSASWIEHLEMPNDIAGAKILDVLDGDAVPHDGHECVEPKYDKDYNVKGEGCGHDSLTVYHTVFRTDRGDIALEYRNDSNGYYGGSLIDAD